MVTGFEVFIMILLTILCVVEIVMIYLALNKKDNSNEVNNSDIMSYDLCMQIVDETIDEIVNKHILYYRLKDITIIPNMSDDIKKISKEIISSLGFKVTNDIEYYLELNYVYSMITRKVQLYLVKYIDTYKPNTK
jgi:hypothetical protein